MSTAMQFGIFCARVECDFHFHWKCEHNMSSSSDKTVKRRCNELATHNKFSWTENRLLSFRFHLRFRFSNEIIRNHRLEPIRIALRTIIIIIWCEQTMPKTTLKTIDEHVIKSHHQMSKFIRIKPLFPVSSFPSFVSVHKNFLLCSARAHVRRVYGSMACSSLAKSFRIIIGRNCNFQTRQMCNVTQSLSGLLPGCLAALWHNVHLNVFIFITIRTKSVAMCGTEQWARARALLAMLHDSHPYGGDGMRPFK